MSRRSVSERTRRFFEVGPAPLGLEQDPVRRGHLAYGVPVITGGVHRLPPRRPAAAARGAPPANRSRRGKRPTARAAATGPGAPLIATRFPTPRWPAPPRTSRRMTSSPSSSPSRSPRPARANAAVSVSTVSGPISKPASTTARSLAGPTSWARALPPRMSPSAPSSRLLPTPGLSGDHVQAFAEPDRHVLEERDIAARGARRAFRKFSRDSRWPGLSPQISGKKQEKRLLDARRSAPSSSTTGLLGTAHCRRNGSGGRPSLRPHGVGYHEGFFCSIGPFLETAPQGAPRCRHRHRTVVRDSGSCARDAGGRGSSRAAAARRSSRHRGGNRDRRRLLRARQHLRASRRSRTGFLDRARDARRFSLISWAIILERVEGCVPPSRVRRDSEALSGSLALQRNRRGAPAVRDSRSPRSFPPDTGKCATSPVRRRRVGTAESGQYGGRCAFSDSRVLGGERRASKSG